MEAKGKQAFLALEPLEADRKLTLGDGEGVTQVQLTVHVGVGEGHHIPEVQFSQIWSAHHHLSSHFSSSVP